MCSCIETVITDMFGNPCNVFGARAVSLLVKVHIIVQNKCPVCVCGTAKMARARGTFETTCDPRPGWMSRPPLHSPVSSCMSERLGDLKPALSPTPCIHGSSDSRCPGKGSVKIFAHLGITGESLRCFEELEDNTVHEVRQRIACSG